MILLARHKFGVAQFHAREHPDSVDVPFARGPVVRLGVRFGRWLGGRLLEADAFIDPGADETILSLRWILEQGGKGNDETPRMTQPDAAEPDHQLLNEKASVEISGRALALGATQRVRILAQPPMAGFEDMLLGRDFLAAHGLLFVVDGEEETFSLLLPADEDNRSRKARIVSELSESASTHGSAAIVENLRHRRLREVLEAYEAEHGAITDDEMAAVHAKWPGE